MSGKSYINDSFLDSSLSTLQATIVKKTLEVEFIMSNKRRR